MKNLAELHQYHNEIASEAQFLKKEIDFLLKVLKKGYSVSINIEKIKTLDGYWKCFEKCQAKLDVILEKVRQDEKVLAAFYQEDLIKLNSRFQEDTLLKQLNLISKEVRVLKDSFYDYTHETNACSCSSHLQLNDVI